jgi:hypothetical protein
MAGCLKALSLQSRDERLSRATLVAYRLLTNDVTLHDTLIYSWFYAMLLVVN